MKVGRKFAIRSRCFHLRMRKKNSQEGRHFRPTDSPRKPIVCRIRKTESRITREVLSRPGHVQFSSSFRGLGIEERRGERRERRERERRVGNFSRVAGNFTLLLGQVSKARLVLVETVVLVVAVLARAPSSHPCLPLSRSRKGLRVDGCAHENRETVHPDSYGT